METASDSTESFGPNWIRVALLVVAALVGYAFGQDLDPSHASIPGWAVSLAKAVMVAVPAVLLCWLLSVRLSVDPVGLHYRSLFGHADMRWDEVDELYAGAVTTLLYGIIPVGTRYRFKLKSGTSTEQRLEKTRYIGKVQFTTTATKNGTPARQLSFGSRFFRADRIGELLNEFTFPPLWRKATQQYNDGRELSFGDFRINRFGVKIDLLGLFPELSKPIPWANVRSNVVEKGSFMLIYDATDATGTTKTYTAKRDVAQIANFRVMMALLQQVKPQYAPSGYPAGKST
jgi:hypothetical protein